MKSEQEIRDRLKEAYQEELLKRLALVGERVPHKCTHNYRHPLDARKVTEEGFNPSYNRVTKGNGLPVLQTVGLCLLGSEDASTWGGVICDEPIDAKRCPVFLPKKGKEEVMEELKASMADESWVKENMPEVYALMWALGEVSTPKVSLWAKILVWLSRPKVEAQLPALPSGD